MYLRVYVCNIVKSKWLKKQQISLVILENILPSHYVKSNFFSKTLNKNKFLNNIFIKIINKFFYSDTFLRTKTYFKFYIVFENNIFLLLKIL